MVVVMMVVMMMMMMMILVHLCPEYECSQLYFVKCGLTELRVSCAVAEEWEQPTFQPRILMPVCQKWSQTSRFTNLETLLKF